MGSFISYINDKLNFSEKSFIDDVDTPPVILLYKKDKLYYTEGGDTEYNEIL